MNLSSYEFRMPGEAVSIQDETGEKAMLGSDEGNRGREQVAHRMRLLAAVALMFAPLAAGAVTVTVAGQENAPDIAGSFGADDDLLEVLDGGVLNTTDVPSSFDQDSVEPPVVIDFGAGDDVLSNEGVVVFGLPRPSGPQVTDYVEAELTLVGLETFENSGLILFGSPRNYDGETSDLRHDDVLSMSGTDFVGLAGSRIVFDVNFSSAGQSACDPSLRLGNGDMPGADCIDLENGSTSGETLVTVRDVFLGDRGANSTEGVVLVDVAGSGTSAAGHFELDPDSDSYNPAHGGVIDKGLFLYPLVYDDARQQHKLAAAPSDDAMQMPLLVEAAEATWRTATASGLDRQVDLRDTLRREPGSGGGAWGRVTTDRGDRDASQSASVYDRDLSYDNSHDVDSSAINFGWDRVFAGEGGRTWLMGAMIGYVHTSLDFERSANRPTLDGMVAGVYAGYLVRDFFVDMVLNSTWTDLHMRIPGIETGVGPDNDTVSTDVRSLGGELETGWRWRTGPFGIEPLASLAYIKTDFDDATVSSSDESRPGNVVDFGDNTSFRGGLGLRFTLDSTLGALEAKWTLTGRVLEEFDEESEVTIKSLGPDMPLASEQDGAITELSGGLSLYNATGSVSAFLNANLQSSDSYDSLGLSAGFRYQW